MSNSQRNLMDTMLLSAERNFHFLDEMGKHFHDGAIYRIYYCKSGQYEPILSIEVSEAVQIE